MRLGVIGRGYWGDTYCRTLERLGIPFWQAGRDWMWQDTVEPADGVIVASSSESHYAVARQAMLVGIPVLIEKPVCLRSEDVEDLIAMGGIAFAGHTRLYSPVWRAFKASVGKVESLQGFAGGVNPTNLDPVWNWATHLAAMSWDLGFDPANADFTITEERQPLRLIANGREFVDDDPTALEVLCREFCAAIEAGKPDNSGLRLGLKTIQYVERKWGRKSGPEGPGALGSPVQQTTPSQVEA